MKELREKREGKNSVHALRTHRTFSKKSHNTDHIYKNALGILLGK